MAYRRTVYDDAEDDNVEDDDMRPLMLGVEDGELWEDEEDWQAAPYRKGHGGFLASFSETSSRKKLLIPLALFLSACFIFLLSGSSDDSLMPVVRNSKREPGELRLDWANIRPQSKIARELTDHRNNCSLPLRYYEPGGMGLGAELHAYTFGMCLAHQRGFRLYTTRFQFMDKAVLNSPLNPKRDSMSVLDSYFSDLELPCEDDEELAREQYKAHRKTDKMSIFHMWKKRKTNNVCASILERPGFQGIYSNLDMRSSAIEAMFTAGLSPAIIQEAQRQHALVFPKGAPPSHQLITVHVRWGDKKSEMELVDIPEYIQAVHTVAQTQGLDPSETHIYLATEDPAAVEAFQAAMHPEWSLYIDQFYLDMLPHRNNVTQEVAGTAREYDHTGLLALGSLLVAMEANHFVLTSASNWSRLMNHLRRSIIQPECSGGYIEPGELTERRNQRDCSTAIDLRKATFWMDLDADGNGL